MIRFQLVCKAGHEFEGWFRSNDNFETTLDRGALSCPVCGDGDVKKAIMAPAVARTGSEPADLRRPALAQLAQMVRAVREHVEAHFENVGDRFPEEVRKIHYGEVGHRDIFGEATAEQAGDLLDEGIHIRPLPSLPKLDG